MINDVPTADDPRRPDYTTEVPHAVLYNHVREFGRPVYHQVRLFASYTKATGCNGPVLMEHEGTIASCLKEMRKWPISKEQRERVHNMMTYRNDGIIASNLQFYRC